MSSTVGAPLVVVFHSNVVTVRQRIRFAEILSDQSRHGTLTGGRDALIDYCEDVASELASSATRRYVDLILDEPSTISVVREAWQQLNQQAASTLIFRIRVAADVQRKRQVRRPTHLVADLCDHGSIALQNKLEVLIRRLPVASAALLLGGVPLIWPSYASMLILAGDPSAVLFDALDEMQLERESKVIFLKSESSRLQKKIPRDFWKRVFAGELPEVLSVGDSLDFGPLRLFERKEIKTLYVFPERMLPLQRAYFSRGFDLLLGLNYGGESAATMIFGPDNRDLERIKKALEIVSPFVATHPLKRGQYTLARRFVRRSEALLRGRIGIKTAPPMRFTERCALFGTERNSVLLEQVICNLPYLRNVVYTGAWFTPSVVPVKKKWPYLRWYCDTHDVFFVLDRDSNSTERRFLYDPAHQRRLEIALLNQADGVIAISDADRASLLAAGCSAQVITESGSFEHAVRGADVSQGPEGLVAGFIGSNNANNEKCLRIVQRIWWPKIVAEFPDAKLLVAGGICKSEVAAQLEQAYPENVQRLGFVDVLSDFYASVNVMLSPIAVQGGLNFKSVEALMAGRPLLTNELGTRCLGSEMTGVYVVGDEGDGIERTLKRLMDNEDGKKLRSATHTHAAQRFGDGAAYRQLIEALKQENQRLEVL